MSATLILAPATKALENYLKNSGLEYHKAEEELFRIYTYDYACPGYGKEVDPMIVGLLKYINKDCSIEGFYDADENSGCTMKFRFDYKDGLLKKYYSEWMTFLCADCFSDYEEFCENIGDRFTEEEYEAFCKDEYYLLDGGDGDAVLADQVPMTEYPLSL